jgi:uncharacterized protein (TIGR03435 family)
MISGVVIRPFVAAALFGFSAYGILAQSTPSASPTIKLSSPYARGATFRAAQHHLVVDNHTLKECIGFAYDLSPQLVSGGPPWIASERYDMVVEMVSDERPALTLQGLLADSFKLQFHRQQAYSPVYNLVVAQSGLKMTPLPAGPGLPSLFVNISPPPSVANLPARNATMAVFAALLQRAAVNRPVMDKTGLSGKYNFDLQWTPGKPTPDSKPEIFTAIQQLGLELVPADALVDTIVVDYLQRPVEN